MNTLLLQRLAYEPRDPQLWPWPLWSRLAAVAVGGTILYGLSLDYICSEGPAATVVTLAAGLSWCLFGLALVKITEQRPEALAHAALWTMTVGEAALVSMAVANLLAGGSVSSHLAWQANVLGVVAVNLLMAGVLAAQLRTLAVPVWKTLAAWVVVLDGSGVALLALFRVLLFV